MWEREEVQEVLWPLTPRLTLTPVDSARILPAHCLSGERHCPPEDVGGVPGYAEFLEVIFEPGTKSMNTMSVGLEGRRPSTARWDAFSRRSST